MKTMEGFLRLWILSVVLGLLVPGANFGQSIATVAGRAGPTGLSATLLNPGGIAVDETGAAYIADTDNHRILKVDTDGNLSTIAGSGNPGGSGTPRLVQMGNPYWVSNFHRPGSYNGLRSG